MVPNATRVAHALPTTGHKSGQGLWLWQIIWWCHNHNEVRIAQWEERLATQGVSLHQPNRQREFIGFRPKYVYQWVSIFSSHVDLSKIVKPLGESVINSPMGRTVNFNNIPIGRKCTFRKNLRFYGKFRHNIKQSFQINVTD